MVMHIILKLDRLFTLQNKGLCFSHVNTYMMSIDCTFAASCFLQKLAMFYLKQDIS